MHSPQQHEDTVRGDRRGPDPSSGTPAPPVVEGWHVRRRLGAGAEAEVWEVQDDDGHRAALKVPLSGGARGLEQEQAALRHHRHRHLVDVRGTVPTDRGPGLLTELLAGGSLAELVRAGGPLSVPQMRTAVVPIAQALQSLHAEGIVHGDVSAANILFDVDGRPALADLGVSRLVGGEGRVGHTPGFAAPEVLDGAVEVGDAADVFSLACCAWFTLTGRSPAAWEDRAPLPLLVPEAGPEVAELLDAALDPDPDARPSAAAFAAALYATGPCAPVHLHAVATAEVALVLPTVRPGEAVEQSGRSGGVRRALPVAAALLATAAAALALVQAVAGPGDGEAAAEPAASGPAASTPTAAPDRRSSPQPSDAQGSAETGGTDRAGPAGTPADTPSPDGSGRGSGLPDARDLQRIAAAREAALLDVDATAVSDYTVAGSDAEAADRTLIDRLRTQDSRFEHLRFSVVPDGPAQTASGAAADATASAGAGGAPVAAGPEGDRPAVVALPVRLETSAHRLVDGQGRLLSAEPGGSEYAVLVVEATGQGWKLVAVRPR